MISIRNALLMPALAALLCGCASSPPDAVADPTPHSVLVLDSIDEAVSSRPRVRLLKLSTDRDTAEELRSAEQLDCRMTGAQLTPDQDTLVLVCANDVPDRTKEGGAMQAARVLKVGLRDGRIASDTVFATSPLGWGWKPAGFSADGRVLFLSIPTNPQSAEYHPLHAKTGFAAYDLEQARLLPDPVTTESGWELRSSRDGEAHYACCWVQGPRLNGPRGSSHPHPGISVVNATDGKIRGSVYIPSPVDQVHTTRLVYAEDSEIYYGLRAGTKQWWELRPRTQEILRQGTIQERGPRIRSFWPWLGPHRVFAKGGPFAVARGAAITGATDRLYSSLYLAENTGSGSVQYLSGSGIQVIALPSFDLVGEIGKDIAWENLAVSNDHAVLFALDQDSRQVSAFDTGDLSLHRKIEDVGHQPQALFPLKNRHLR